MFFTPVGNISMFVTPVGNISNIKNHIYPTLMGFLIIIQLFGAIFFVITPHIYVMFHLHAQHVINELLGIDNYMYDIIQGGKKQHCNGN
jgi:hypothetical protein